MAATITNTTAMNTNVTTSVTNTIVTSAGGARLQKTVYKVQHSFQVRNPGYEFTEKESLLARAPIKLPLHSRYTTLCNVTNVTETLTRVGPAISPAAFMRHVQRLRAQKLMLTPAKKLPATAAPAQAAPDRDSPVLPSHSAAPLPPTVANADTNGDVEMTGATTVEVATLSDETMRRRKVALAQLARSTGLHFSEPRRVVQSASQAPPAISVGLPGTAAAATLNNTQQVRLVVRRIAPSVRVLAIRRVGMVQNNEQPPPYSAADEARLNAAHARTIAQRR